MEVAAGQIGRERWDEAAEAGAPARSMSCFNLLERTPALAMLKTRLPARSFDSAFRRGRSSGSIGSFLPEAQSGDAATAPPEGSTFVSRRQVADLGLELKELRRAELAAFRLGRSVLYKRADVLALVERYAVRPAQNLPVLELPVQADPFERARVARRAAL